MYKHLQKLLFRYIGFIALLCCLFSCASTKQLRYFQDLPDSTKLANIKLANFVKPVIQPGDILSITLFTIDETAAVNVNLANSPAASLQTGTTQADLSGYMVDKDGYIEMVAIGKIKVSGLTIEQAQDKIKIQALKYFKDPVINIKNKNTKITVLGEIGHPGIFNVTTEKVSVLDVLGLAGDLTISSNRENILLLRHDENNTLSSIRLNMKSSEILKSPYFYLQNNDVIIVEPNKQKALTSDAGFARNLQLLTAGVSLLSVMYLIFRK